MVKKWNVVAICHLEHVTKSWEQKQDLSVHKQDLLNKQFIDTTT